MLIGTNTRNIFNIWLAAIVTTLVVVGINVSVLSVVAFVMVAFYIRTLVDIYR